MRSRPLIWPLVTTKRVSYSKRGVSLTEGTDHVIDYVFVDEHNRHKRLKGVISHEAVVVPLLIQ